MDRRIFLEEWNVKTRDCEHPNCIKMNPHTCIIKSSVSLFQIYSPLFTSHLFTSAQVAKKKKILHSYSTIFLHTTYIFNADLHCQSRKTCRVLHSGKLTAKYFCNCLLLLVTKWQKKCRKLHWRICKKKPSSLSNGHPETATKDTALELELRSFLWKLLRDVLKPGVENTWIFCDVRLFECVH